MKNNKQWAAWLILLVWIVMIFRFSAQVSEVSTGLSREVAQKLIRFLEKPSKMETWDLSFSAIHFLVRKLAHFFEYTVLGVIMVALYQKHEKTRKISWLWAWMLCTFIAAADETFQFFVDGRDASLRDVMIDSVGSATGILIAGSILFLVGRCKKRSARKEGSRHGASGKTGGEG